MPEELKNSYGKKAELFVAKILRDEGHRILECNYTCRRGEIDIIYLEKSSSELVFAEVKYRKNSRYGNPYEYVTKSKLNKIKSCAFEYLTRTCKENYSAIRFDVFSVTGDFVLEHFVSVME